MEKSSKTRSLFLWRNQYFYRQTNVFTKELISRNFFSVIAFYSTFPTFSLTKYFYLKSIWRNIFGWERIFHFFTLCGNHTVEIMNFTASNTVAKITSLTLLYIDLTEKLWEWISRFSRLWEIHSHFTKLWSDFVNTTFPSNLLNKSFGWNSFCETIFCQINVNLSEMNFGYGISALGTKV